MTSRGFDILSQDFHLIKRKTSKGKAVYYAGFLSGEVGKNGKALYKSMRSTGEGNRSAAEKVARKMLKEGKVLATKMDLEGFMRAFWDPKKSDYIRSVEVETGREFSMNYLLSQKVRVERYFLPFFKKHRITKLADLDRRNLKAWRNHLAEHGYLPEYEEELEKKTGKKRTPVKISATTQNKVRQAVWTALQYAVDEEMLPYHPGAGIRRVHEEPKPRRIFELDELALLFAEKWDDVRAYAACFLAAATGARMGEVRGLQIRNTHLEERYIDIVTNYVGFDGLKKPKWNATRLNVKISPLVVGAIEDVYRIHPTPNDPDAFVFFSERTTHAPMDSKQITKHLQKRVTVLQLPPGRTFHSFRHSWVSHMEGRLGSTKVQKLIGHTNTQTTLRYTHVTNEDNDTLAEAVNLIGSPSIAEGHHFTE